PIAATICAIALIVSKVTLDVYQTNPNVTMSILFACCGGPRPPILSKGQSGSDSLATGHFPWQCLLGIRHRVRPNRHYCRIFRQLFRDDLVERVCGGVMIVEIK